VTNRHASYAVGARPHFLFALLLAALPASAQVVNPAEAQKPPDSLEQEVEKSYQPRVPTWKLPGETVVIGHTRSP